MIQNQKKEALSRISQISEMLVRGNKKSKNVARIISSLSHILFELDGQKTREVFTKIMPIYTKLYAKHNSIYKSMGGKSKGDTVEAPVRDGIKAMKLEGVDLEGFNTLSRDAIEIGNLALTTGDPFLNTFNDFLWTGLVSIHDDRLQEELVRICLKYDTRIS
jgi:hypothetical protein